MDLRLSSEDRLIAQSAGDLFSACSKTAALEPTPAEVNATWRRLAENGWTAVLAGESEGLGMTASLLAAQEAGRHALPLAYSDVAVAVPAALVRGGEVARDVLQGIASGSVLCAPAGVDLLVDGMRGHAPIVADGRGSEWLLRGSALNVPHADIAHVFLVAALDTTSSLEESLFVVPRQAGIEVTNVASVDVRCAVYTVTFPDAPLHEVRRLPSGCASRLVTAGAAGCCAEMVGAASALEQMTIEYVQTRRQFGQPVGAFQAVKHHCADVHVAVEAMTVAVASAAIALTGDDESETQTAVSVAKSYCSTAALTVAEMTHQLHGGIAFTWEYPLHQHMKRILRLRATYGDARWHLERLAESYFARTSGASCGSGESDGVE